MLYLSSLSALTILSCSSPNQTQPQSNIITKNDKLDLQANGNEPPKTTNSLNTDENKVKKDSIASSNEPKVKFLSIFDDLDGRMFLSSDGKRLATLGYKSSIYDLGSNRLLSRFPDFGSMSGSAVAMSPDWQTMAVGQISSGILIRDVQNGEILRSLPINVQNERAMTYSNKSSNILFAGSRDGSVQAFDVSTGKVLNSIEYGKSEVKDIVLDSIQNRFLAVNYLFNGVVVWELSGQNVKSTVLTVPNSGTAISLSPDGSFLAIGYYEGLIKVYSIRSRLMIYETQPEIGHSVQALKFSPDSKYLLSGHYSEGFRVWEANTGKLLQRIKIGQGAGIASETVSQIEFSPNGTLLFTDGDSLINIWKFQN